MTNREATYWVEKLHLRRHPEGGYFREIYRSPELFSRDALPPRFEGARSTITLIYYLLPGTEFSALHRLKSVETWHFLAGSPLELHIIGGDGGYSLRRLGPDPDRGEQLQAVVEPGCWFGARVPDRDSYSLVGCGVVPGFDFSDFELGRREDLAGRFPQHREIIGRLTH